MLANSRHIMLYLILGGFTTLINIVVYFIAREFLAFNWQISYMLAWAIAVLFAYLTNRTWVFHSPVQGFQARLREMVKFYMGRVLSGILGWLILGFGVTVLHGNDQIWNIIQNVFVVISNYFISKWYVFKNKPLS